MPITPGELKVYKTVNGLGGAITVNEVTSSLIHDVFDVVDSDGALFGEINYRCIYIKNTNSTITLETALAYIIINTVLSSTELAIGVGTSLVDGVEQVIPDEDTSPNGVIFVEDIGEENSIILGNLLPNTHRAIWLRRSIQASTPATDLDSATFRISGDTIQ